MEEFAVNVDETNRSMNSLPLTHTRDSFFLQLCYGSVHPTKNRSVYIYMKSCEISELKDTRIILADSVDTHCFDKIVTVFHFKINNSS